MKKSVWINLVMAVLVAGLFLVVSCAKTTVVSDVPPIQDRSDMDADDAKIAADRLKAEKLREQEIRDQELSLAKTVAAKDRFGNQDVHFEYDSADLSLMAKSVLKEKAAWLQANSGVSVTVEGHCDERGTTDYNLALGERRANAAKSYLVNLGISASRLDSISFGEEKPLDASSIESAFRKNRRAHFVIK